jgi:hypothetical protein
MRDHHFYIIVALLLLVLFCLMNHTEGFDYNSPNWKIINKSLSDSTHM